MRGAVHFPQQRLPMPLRKLHTDNGSEFLNYPLRVFAGELVRDGVQRAHPPDRYEERLVGREACGHESGHLAAEMVLQLLYVAAVDYLALENSVARSRTLVAGTLAAAKLLEVSELEQRIGAVEGAVNHQQLPPPVFGVE